MSYAKHLLMLLVLLLLSGCDMLGLDTPAKQRALSEADGKAVGAACRHAGRAIEDCYILNPTANRAAVFTGWREMNDYMTKNKIEVVKPQSVPAGGPAATAKAAGSAASPTVVFEPPAKTGTAAQFIPPEGIKKDSQSEKKPSGSPPVPNPVPPATSGPQKSASKDSRVMANVDDATVMRAKEQAHTTGSKSP